jgi:hypothetical protein
MKIKQEQFNSAQETFSKKSLSNIQKQTMLSNIYSENKMVISQPIKSPFISHFTLIKQKILVLIVIIFLIISGTSYASAMSLPGDLLYSVKVDILEPIGTAIRLNEISKNDYKISLLGKRVDELTELKKKGDIYEVSQKASSKAVNKNVKELEKSAIFNEKGQNIIVSEKVKSYNNLINEDLKIETNIKIDDDKEEEIDKDKENGDKNIDKNDDENKNVDENDNDDDEKEIELTKTIDAEDDVIDNVDANTDNLDEITDEKNRIETLKNLNLKNKKDLPSTEKNNLAI